jgi:putative iron-only hydrogenase system regulator
MENKAAIIAIIVEKPDSVEKLNGILHEYAQYIIGRMGLPYPKKNINIISIVVDAPNNTIDALSGKISALEGISAKTVYSA